MLAISAAVAAAAPEKNRVTIGKISDVPQGTQPSPIVAAIDAIPLSPTCRDTVFSLSRLFFAVKITAAIDIP